MNMLKAIKPYLYTYKLLGDYMRRVSANFLFQFFIHRYLELSSLLLVFFASSINFVDSQVIVLAVATFHLLVSLMINEAYVKILPYLRVIYLSKSLGVAYLILNTSLPLLLYIFLFEVFISEPKTFQQIGLMCLLLFNNTLLSHSFHSTSFSWITGSLLLLLIFLYLLIYLNSSLILIAILSLVATVTFAFSLKNY